MNAFTTNGEPVPRSATGVASFADVIMQVSTWADLTERTRRDLKSALRTATRIIGVPAENIPADPAYLNEVMFRRSPAALGIGASARTTIVSRVRKALRRSGNHAALRSPECLPPGWRSFLERAQIRAVAASLQGLADWAAERGLGPEDLSEPDIQAFCGWDKSHRISPSATQREAGIARSWRKVTQAQPEPHPFTSYRAPAKRRPYVRPLADFAASFQADVKAFERSIGRGAGSTPFSATNKRNLRPATIDLRVFALRQAASVLVMLGVPLEEVRTLRDLVTPASRPAGILDHFYAKAGNRLNGQIWNIAETLRQIAQHHVGIDQAECNKLREFTRKISDSKPKGISGKVREKLKELTHRQHMIRLLHLPDALVRKAQDVTLTELERARLVRNATIIELLTFAPLRLSNVRFLSIESNLLWLGVGEQRHLCLRIHGARTKNGDPIDWPLPPSTSRLFERYLHGARAVLAQNGNPYVFPGRFDGAIDDVTLYNAVRETTLRYVGVPVHPHLMRHFAAWLFLQANPGSYEVVRRILGHRKVETTVAHYCGLETDAAASALQDAVVRSRDETSIEARAAYRRNAGSLGQAGHPPRISKHRKGA